jgi:hypothetical protein
MYFYHQILFDFDGNKKKHSTTREHEALSHNINKFKDSFQHKCWNLDESIEFTKQHYPFLVCIFDAETKFNIIKCDFFRYLLLYHHGGLYTDIDFLCIKSLDEFVHCVLSSKLETVNKTSEQPLIVLTEEWYDSMYMTQTIHNGCLFSERPKHPFWMNLILDIYEKLITKRVQIKSESDVYELSGPKKLHNFYKKHIDIFKGVIVLPYYYCCPFIAVTQSNSSSKETYTVLCNRKDVIVPEISKSVWVFFNMDHYEKIELYCPNSFFVNINLKSGSMWKK